MENVLVAVDGSEESLRAARFAVELAAPFHAKVTLLHVVPPIVLPGDAPWVSLAQIEEAEFEGAEGLVRELKGKLGVEAQTLVKRGGPADTIVEVASTLKDCLVVVGSRGKGAVKRLLLGSVADRVVHLSHGPVLIAR